VWWWSGNPNLPAAQDRSHDINDEQGFSSFFAVEVLRERF
jgi:hypothetical protein